MARFWSDEYYRLIFPLRFGYELEDKYFFKQKDLFPEKEFIKPEISDTRKRFLDGAKLPPLLPGEQNEEPKELLVDRLLTQTALANTLIRQSGSESHIHAVRLGFLTYPFLKYLESSLSQWPEALEIAKCDIKRAGADCLTASIPKRSNRSNLSAISTINTFGW